MEYEVIVKWAAFRYYKVGQSETALFFTNRNDFITKWDRYYKAGQFYYKAGQVLQSETIITKWALHFALKSLPLAAAVI